MKVKNRDFKALNNLAIEFMSTAKSKGFYSSNPYNLDADIAAMHAEVSELWEADRAGRLNQPCDKSAKMLENLGVSLTCSEEEVADLVIKSLCIAHALNVDIGHAVEVKNDFNKTRPFRHGKK